MKKQFIISLGLCGIVACCLFSHQVLAQDLREKQDSTKTKSAVKDTVLDKGRYNKEYNWVVLGAGLAKSLRGLDGNLGINYQFKGKRLDILYRQIGFESGKEYAGGLFPRDYARFYYELHFGLGVKTTHKKYLFGAFLSASAMQGTDSLLTSTMPPSLFGLGTRLDLQAIYHPFYDLGGGFNLYAVYSTRYYYVGFRFVAFFSNAFKSSLYPKAYHLE